MTTDLPNWRKAVTPHRDIQENRVTEALFAVNLSRAIAREGADEYRDPTLFFERTHLTRTLKSLIRDVLRVFQGESEANRIIHLQTNFGGGKTHAELALYHLLKTPKPVLAVPAVAQFLAENNLTTVPAVQVAALPCADLYAGGRQVAEGFTVYTLWGEVAYRLGQADLYQLVRHSDEQRAAPGVSLLRQLLTAAGPNLILIDELLHYVDKAAAIQVGNSNLATQTVGFLRELTEAVDSVPHSILVASLTASRVESLEVLSEDEAAFTLSKLEDTMRRVEDARAPIESSEIYDIVRTRLFQAVADDVAGEIAAAYSQFYRRDPWKDLLPPETREVGYEALLKKSYPFHPTIIRVLYERWGSRPQFQLTRGTLRFLSHLLAHLWHNQPDKALSPLIHLADVDLGAEKVRAEAVQVAGSEWEAVIGTDVAASQKEALALAQRLDRDRGGLYRKFGLNQGLATCVFMFTHGGPQEKATPRTDIRLAVVNPAIPISDLNQAFDDCKAKLYHYYEEEGGCLFKTEPNPNKVLADQRANVHTDDARLKMEDVVSEVLGKASSLFQLNYYGFKDNKQKEPGDIPDDSNLQLVILPPRLTISRGKVTGKTETVLNDIANNYGKRLRFNRNMVLFMAPNSDDMANAIDRAMDWLAALSVKSDAQLMERFSETQQEVIRQRAITAENDTKDFVRKAYNTVILPGASGSRELFELSYVPPSKKVIDQAEDELTSQQRKLHKQFNPALLETRWVSLWPKTATVITTSTLWEKFTRQVDAPILTGVHVLQETIRLGVEQELFGYGLLRDSDQDKLKPTSYERVFLGPFDARELYPVEISQRAVLLRVEQLNTLFPPISKEEIAMLLIGPRQLVEKAFAVAREGYKNLTIQGRVDKNSFFQAILEGVKAGLFGYAESANSPVLRGNEAELELEQIHFSGLLIGEDVSIPVTADEIAKLIPTSGRIAVPDLFQRALENYGAARVTEQNLLNALQRCLNEQRFGYAATETDLVESSVQLIGLTGYVGKPELPPPDTRVIRLSGTISPPHMIAQVLQPIIVLSKLGQPNLTVNIALELKGEVNDHAVNNALNDLQKRVPGLKVEDVKGE